MVYKTYIIVIILSSIVLIVAFRGAISLSPNRLTNVIHRSSVSMSSNSESDNFVQKKTFKRFMQVELWRAPELESLYSVLCSLELACRDINRLMRRVVTDNLDGYNSKGLSTTTNIQGEDQKKLDVIANRIMKITLCCSGNLQSVASEEEDEACLCSDVADNAAFCGEYAAVFDPLDGSSNIDSGLPTGTIFGIYKTPKFQTKSETLSTLKQKGSNLVVAGYCLYSASTHIVLTLRTGVHMFTLDEEEGEFFLTRSNVRIPRHGNIYSFNDAYSSDWPSWVNYYINDFKKSPTKKPTNRYMGALVADCHNILLNGGVFGYPGTINKPAGKLRLLYEANPMAVIFEEAGGLASNGMSRILDVNVDDIHQRVPFFVGSYDDIIRLEKYRNFYTPMLPQQ